MNNIISNIEDAFIKIGYRHQFIKKSYEYVDLFTIDTPLRIVDRAIFGQEPLDYRSACFGIGVARPSRASEDIVYEMKALGAPQVFIINNGTTERWTITAREPVLQEKYQTSKLPRVIVSNRNNWKPDVIMRTKSGFTHPGEKQLDFVDLGLLPALEQEASIKIDYLLQIILNFTEEDFKRDKLKFEASAIFKVVFSLLAAKLFKDRNIVNSNIIDFGNPETALQAVRSHYGSQLMKAAAKIPPTTLINISREIGQSFSFRNISVDTLTYVYENTFVSPKSRKSLGIHSTPSFVADYLLSQIPIEELPKTNWHVIDPMCGHGILLIAAMRRMRDHLPTDWGKRRRHTFFIEHLHGIEVDPVSIEVARMCLMLADFPESNGWDIVRADAFEGDILEKASKKSMIMVANPPFEGMKINNRTVPKPLELIKRTLPSLPDGSLIGLVMPRSFLDSSAYKNERKHLLDSFEINTITTLPDKIFQYSDAETAIISAKKRTPRKTKVIVYKEVRDAHREAFKTKNGFTWQEIVFQSYFDEVKDCKLIVPLLKELWDCLKLSPHLEDIATFKTGVRYKSGISINNLVRRTKSPNFKQGIYNVTDGFCQYIAYDNVYMSVDEKNIENDTWQYHLHSPKIIVPAARMSRGPWRFAAVIDLDRKIISRRFYGVWPQNDSLSIYSLSALLNSPVAQAFAYCNVSERDILIRTYKDIPIPETEKLIQSDKAISNLVKTYLEELKIDDSRACNTLLMIDAEILKLYNLTPKLERQLLDIFWKQKRPVPFEFKGYIPPEMISWIPLHIYISETFQEGTVEKVMSRIPFIKDKEFINYLKRMGTE